MDLAKRTFEATADQLKALSRARVNQGDLKRYVRMVLFPKKGSQPAVTWTTEETAEVSLFDKEKDHAEEQAVERMYQSVSVLAESGMGQSLPGVAGTWWAAYNGMTEHLNHVAGKSQDNRLDALWFGPVGARALSAASQLAAS
jgi:hypothetical protein